MQHEGSVNVERERAIVEAIRRISALHGNDKYMLAWKVALRVLNDMLVERNNNGTDRSQQISS